MTQPADTPSLALRFGQVCRAVFPQSPWTECEALIRRHWEHVRGAGDWETEAALIRQGWDLGAPSAP